MNHKCNKIPPDHQIEIDGKVADLYHLNCYGGWSWSASIVYCPFCGEQLREEMP